MAIAEEKYLRWLWLILIAGLALRLLYAMDLPTLALFRHGGGGDSGWYLANGAGFFSGKEHGWIRGIPYMVSELPTPPFYILFAGIFQTFLPKHESVVVIRIIQCFVSVGTAYLAFKIASRIAADCRAGLIAAFGIALNPAFIVESTNIATETLYIFFIVIGLWLYIEYVVPSSATRTTNRLSARQALILTALAFGIATLTRAVFLLFPFGVALHMWLQGYRNGSRLWGRWILQLLIVYMAIVSTWTVYNLVAWNRFVIVSDQLMPTMWRAAVSNDGSPVENDKLLLQGAENSDTSDCESDCKFQHSIDTYITQIQASVNQDPGGFVLRRLNELAASLVQPHGTASFGSVSITKAASRWLQIDRSLEGLLQVTQIEGFAIKLLIWIFHCAAIVLGLIGMWSTRKSWRVTSALIGFVLYTVLVHLLVLAIPRYMFPIEVIWLIFASITLVALGKRLAFVSSKESSTL